jgi:hypothetical protein
MTAATGNKPNIIMIVSDDFGDGDAGCYLGGEAWGMPTPNIDRLAAEGASSEPAGSGIRYESMSKPKFADSVRENDTRIGRIMDKVRALGLDKNTYVFWTSDNGAWQDVYPDAGYTPFRGTKGTDREGGSLPPRCRLALCGRSPLAGCLWFQTRRSAGGLDRLASPVAKTVRIVQQIGRATPIRPDGVGAVLGRIAERGLACGFIGGPVAVTDLEEQFVPRDQAEHRAAVEQADPTEHRPSGHRADRGEQFQQKSGAFIGARHGPVLPQCRSDGRGLSRDTACVPGGVRRDHGFADRA